MPRPLNKKGESTDQGFTPFHILIALLLFIVMGFMILVITNDYINAFLAFDKDIPKHVYAYRAINTCLAYQDPITNRFYPGIIDLSKYNQEVLDRCYGNSSLRSFNIQLKDITSDKEYDVILVGFGAVRSVSEYPIYIRNLDGSMTFGSFLFGMRERSVISDSNAK